MQENSLITVINTTKSYKGRRALDNISFKVNKGEIFGLIGPNGAGKSTFISLLATIIKPESGDILVDGKSIIKYPNSVRKRMGYVPQEIALYPMLTTWENMEFWGGIYGVPQKIKEQRIEQVLRLLKLYERKDDKVRTFSGGMKRRLNIAASLLHQPDILVMDEPTAGVDVLSRAAIGELILTLKEEGCTILVTSHHIDELQKLVDRIAILNQGKLLFSGTVEDVLEKTSTESLEKLMLKLEES